MIMTLGHGSTSPICWHLMRESIWQSADWTDSIASYHTFLTRRFDRTPESRLHFSSAMMQLGYYDGEYEASYLELAQLLTDQGANTRADLAELWRRIVFNIAVSNTDDHLRNHGFIYHKGGWLLSPAYNINPIFWHKAGETYPPCDYSL